MARQLLPLFADQAEEVGDYRSGLAGAGSKAVVSDCTIDLALDSEEFVDPLDGLGGQWCGSGDTWSGLALYGQTGELEELALGMGPEGHLDERGWTSGLLEQRW